MMYPNPRFNHISVAFVNVIMTSITASTRPKRTQLEIPLWQSGWALSFSFRMWNHWSFRRIAMRLADENVIMRPVLASAFQSVTSTSSNRSGADRFTQQQKHRVSNAIRRQSCWDLCKYKHKNHFCNQLCVCVRGRNNSQASPRHHIWSYSMYSLHTQEKTNNMTWTRQASWCCWGWWWCCWCSCRCGLYIYIYYFIYTLYTICGMIVWIMLLISMWIHKPRANRGVLQLLSHTFGLREDTF